MKRRYAILILVLTIINLLAVQLFPVFAEITSKADGQRKINLSGRQRMLSQFMAKAACFASINIHKKHHLNQMGQTHWLFSETLLGLRNGSIVLGLLREKNSSVLDGLKLVEDEWSTYGAAVLAWQNDTARNEATLKSIFEQNIPTLIKMNDVVKMFEEVYSQSGAVDPGIAVALNISGRQRMLTQKASKEACLIYKGYKADQNRIHLLKTIDLFSTSLRDLLSGNSKIGVPAAPVSIIKEQLDMVKTLWVPFQKILMVIQKSNSPDLRNLTDIAEKNELILQEMNKAVWLYEAIN